MVDCLNVRFLATILTYHEVVPTKESERYTGILSLSVAVLLVAAACSTPTVDSSAQQPTGGAVPAAGEMSGQMVHAGTDDVIDVELSDFAINAGRHMFTAGESIEFRVVNTGIVPHEFRLSNQIRVLEHVSAGHEGHEGATPEEMADMDMEGMDDTAAEGAEHAEAPGAEVGEHAEAPEAEDVILFLEPGESGTLVFHFPEDGGDYTMAVCLVPGHYEAGMTTDLSFAA